MESDIAREAILASIRSHLAASVPHNANHGGHMHGPTASAKVKAGIELSPDELIKEFCEALRLVGGKCLVAEGEIQAAKILVDVVGDLKARKIAISDSDLVGRLTAGMRGAEIKIGLSKSELFECDLGITSAQWGIAETGTLALESDSERHRLVSLVPPVHVCVLPASRIRRTLGEILSLTRENLSRAITFITGASRTSDIELTLAIGVHGPGELRVIVVKD